MFVSKHGGQSEIVLRVKQGDNPTFGFLMPDHQLHPYFRFLVDHQELLKSDGDGASLEEENKAGGGALSLLGSVYGSGEDEDGQTEDASELKRDASGGAVDTVSVTAAHEPEQRESSSSVDVTGKDDAVLKNHPPLKDKAHFIKRNRSISAVKSGSTSGMKKEGDAVGLHLSAADNIQGSGSPLKVDVHILEPPSEMKRVVDKIVEFIMKNGREFEAILVQQDIEHGRFPFLLPSNQYHPYYLKVLQKSQESRLPGKGIVSGKRESMRHGGEKKTAMMKESDPLSIGSDIPYDSDRKEKFKMVIGKSKKDGQDAPSKATEPAQGVSVDAAAAAAILRAATKGIKYPDLGILSKNALNGISQGPSSEGGEVSIQELGQDGESSVSVPVAKAIAKTVAVAAASEADSSEANLTKEQKLKAERLKRAKMFSAMIKSGAATSKPEQLRGLSVEPLESGASGSLAEVVNFAGKEREASTVPLYVETNNKVDLFEKDSTDCNERRSKRSYRSRSKIHDDEEEGETKEEEREEEEETGGRDRKRSGKKRRSHRSSHRSRDRHKHRKRHSSKDRHSRHRHKHDSSSEDELRHSRRHKRCDNSSSEDEHWRSKHHHKCTISSGDEDRKQSGSINKNGKKSKLEGEVELEEGEIYTKSDQSKASEGGNASREASVDISKMYQDVRRTPSQPSRTPEPSDELRAKIRAMLMATL
ncbi:protein suppressor of white apricot isoform X2 [Tripterygium wilfordii]|nr:protein suppressor of white apricot isoform X2 [Tripterygium wilfordii]XP_038685406.1 protein suppressor of white apricot isoform X2 [Tripterygium wilfordii]XP_038685408.1 protein suppressor of white apricot isoform X2 [Tripterygium wilfordii]XP_038685409.1 protein suppressor of white apricot isoform X2 [Tripterygium wilfordii]XP_038685410.1 protein suppressor of white apricot isoform X2 [Tripterygium wilfordii]XP_038685411.1 protein suppressor of white apricot isoform X2 [Tripterygium wilf